MCSCPVGQFLGCVYIVRLWEEVAFPVLVLEIWCITETYPIPGAAFRWQIDLLQTAKIIVSSLLSLKKIVFFS